jgi:hypothetical protein
MRHVDDEVRTDASAIAGSVASRCTRDSGEAGDDHSRPMLLRERSTCA